MTNNLNSNSPRRPGLSVAGAGGLALATVLLLCGAGNAPIENFTPQGTMQADLNAGGHSVTNAAAFLGTNGQPIYAPVSGSTNYAPASGSPNYAPVTGSTNYAPASGSASYAPAAGSTNYAPASGSTSYAPLAGSTNYAPASGSTSYAPATGSTNYVPQSTTINGHALTSNVTVTPADIGGVNAYTAAIAVTGTGTTTLTRTAPTTSYLLNVAAGSGSYVNSVPLSLTNAISGDVMNVTVAFPASTNPSLPFYNGSTSGTLLLTSTTNGLAAASHTLHFAYDGTKWNLQSDGAVLSKNLGANESAALTTAANTAGGHATVPPAVIYLSSFANGTPNTKQAGGTWYAGSTALYVSGNPFTSADVGKTVVLPSNTTGGRQVTTIASLVNSGEVQMAANATQASTAVSGEFVYYGTDNTSAMTAALAAASAAGGAKIVCDPGIYLFSGAPQNTSSYNTIFQVPSIQASNSGAQGNINISITGSGATPGFCYSQQFTIPITSGTVFYFPNSTVTGSFPSCFAEAPVAGGSGAYGYNHTGLEVSGITFRQPDNAAMTTFQWAYGGPLDIHDCAFDLDKAYNQAGGQNPADPTSNAAWAIITPGLNNDAWTKIKNVYIWGRYGGVMAGEHSEIDGLSVDICVKGLAFYGATAAQHNVRVGRALLQRCKYNLSFYNPEISNGKTFGEISDVDFEDLITAGGFPSWAVTTYDILDTNNAFYGLLRGSCSDSSGTGQKIITTDGMGNGVIFNAALGYLQSPFRSPNQTGTIPGDSDLLNHNQVIRSLLGRFWQSAPIGSWTAASGSSGSSLFTAGSNDVQMATSSTTGSYGQAYVSPRAITTGASASNSAVDFSKNLWIRTTFYASNGGTGALPNTVARFNIGRTSFTPGAPATASVGFKLVFDTAAVAHFFGEAYGSSLVTSGAALASPSSTAGYIHSVLINSNGSGTITYWIDGTQVGTLTGGPIGATASGAYIDYEILNSGDATGSGNFFFTPPVIYVENGS